MPRPVDVLASEVLQLSASERSRLLSQIVNSLEEDASRDARWDFLAAQRDAQADADPSTLLSGDEALARIKAEIR